MPKQKHALTYQRLSVAWGFTRQRAEQLAKLHGIECLLNPDQMFEALQAYSSSKVRTFLTTPAYREEIRTRIGSLLRITELDAEVLSLKKSLGRRPHRPTK